MTTNGAWLLGALLVCHFLGDFSHLSTDRMQAAKAAGRPLTPILAHATVHAALVLLAVMLVTGVSWSLALAAAGVELGTHFTIDATRARLGAKLPQLRDSSRRTYWYVLGLDQLLHGLVLLWIVVLVRA